MKKVFNFLLLIVAILTISACGKKQPAEPEKEKLFYEHLPMPSETIDKTTKSVRDKNHTEYILYVSNYSYEQFHAYIAELEKLGFNYSFFKETVPEKQEMLSDKTETSWAANNGSIWIRAQWRDESNVNFKGNSLQLIFDNYDYLKPIEPVATGAK